MVVIRAGSAAHAAQIAAVQRETWFAAYEGIIAPEVIDRVTVPDDGARVRQSFRSRPWQRVLVAVDPGTGDPGTGDPGTGDPGTGDPGTGDPGTSDPGTGDPGVGGIVGYASFGPETDVLNAPWPHPLTVDGEGGRVAELYALYVRPAWWSTGTGRALMGKVLARSAAAGYRSITLWVLRDNQRARQFYERAGFAPDGATNVLTGLGSVIEVRYRRALDQEL